MKVQGCSQYRRCSALQAAIKQGFFNEDANLMLIDVDMIESTISHIQEVAGYPKNTLHTFAVKANPVGKVLKLFKDKGCGAEAASLAELSQALHVGFEPQNIVFDSPAKTIGEIRYTLEKGVRMNLDNFQELERVATLLGKEPQLLQPNQYIGLRINPQVGTGSIAALSTGGLISKFGFPLLEARKELLAAFQTHPWLNMLHLHVGSQGLPTEKMIDGVEAVWGLLQEVEALVGKGRVKVLDIGGGLNVDFLSDDEPQETRFQEQARLLKERVPELFVPDCGVQLMTENGRLMVCKAGCVASRVEYTKSSGGRAIAVIQVGADLFPRTCFLPETWALRVAICGPDGQPKEEIPGVEWLEQDIAGPCCFQGDRLAVAKRLPKAEVGDFVMVLDTGAYTLSMYSRYNSRCSPAVYGYTCGTTDPVSNGTSNGPAAGAKPLPMDLRKLRGAESVENVMAFFNLE